MPMLQEMPATRSGYACRYTGYQDRIQCQATQSAEPQCIQARLYIFLSGSEIFRNSTADMFTSARSDPAMIKTAALTTKRLLTTAAAHPRDCLNK